MSQTLVLFGNKQLTSPYVFSAFVALQEKQLPFELQLIDLDAGEQHRPSFVSHSVTNRVPTLQHDDFWLSESSAIAEYLEDVFPPPAYQAVYPQAPRERARVRMVQALLRSDFLALREDRPTTTIFGGRRADKPLSPKAATQAERLIRIATSLLETHETSLTGSFTVADADLALMLQRLAKNGDPLPAPLQAFAQAIWDRPSVQAYLTRATTPTG